jgi:flagellar hook-basal body complex protein FliE
MPDITSQFFPTSVSMNPNTSTSSSKVTPGEAHDTFASQLKNAIDGVNKSQMQSNKMTEALARGEADDLHNVMITAQKASITMQTTVEVQNKVVEAYKEIMRMQV